MKSKWAYKNREESEFMSLSASEKSKISDLLSEQLNIELSASKLYLMAYQFFSSRPVALLNVADFFYNEVYEELTHAKGIIEYMNSMGYKVNFKDTRVDVTFNNFTDVFEKALEFEKKAYDNVLEIYEYADGIKDFMTTQFLDPYLQEQVKSVKDYNDLLVNAKRCQDELGMFVFDKHFKK
ncbi:Ferritin, middle subunit [Dictyocoela roeselum]|nr:Ferritin, middle subunit [Dictyocoela roeselum]